MTNYFELFDKRLSAIESNQQQILAKLATTHPNPADEDEPHLNVAQAAEFLGVSKQTVYQRRKDLPFKKRFGRLYIYPSDLRAYLEGGVPA